MRQNIGQIATVHIQQLGTTMAVYKLASIIKIEKPHSMEVELPHLETRNPQPSTIGNCIARHASQEIE